MCYNIININFFINIQPPTLTQPLLSLGLEVGRTILKCSHLSDDLTTF